MNVLILKNIQNWYLRVFHSVGEKVFWENRVDPTFTGIYVITTKRNKNGFVGIYNKIKGDRIVPYYYLSRYDDKKHSQFNDYV